jgi:ferredoxin
VVPKPVLVPQSYALPTRHLAFPVPPRQINEQEWLHACVSRLNEVQRPRTRNAIAPQVYTRDDGGHCDIGKDLPVPPHLEAAARHGAASCPERAITLSD